MLRANQVIWILFFVHAQKVAVAALVTDDRTVVVEERIVLALAVARVILCEGLLIRLVEVVRECPLDVALIVYEAVFVRQSAVEYKGDIDDVPAEIGRNDRIRTDAAVRDQILRRKFKLCDVRGSRFDALDRLAVIGIEASRIGGICKHQLVDRRESLIGNFILDQIV